jgi:acetyl-CoA acetyltransferase
MTPAMRNPLRNQVVVAGVGYSPAGKSLGRSELDLALEAGRNALADAGLRPDDVDGLSTYPDRSGANTFAGPAIMDIQRGLGLHNLRYWSGSAGNGAAQFAGVTAAAYTILGGGADVVLCSRTVIAQPRVKTAASRTESLAWLSSAYVAPFGMGGSAPKWALQATRFLHDTGQDEEALAAIVLNNRAMAQRNPRAAWYGKPLTKDEYYDAPLIASPLRIVDCDMPIDAACMVVLARADRVADLAHPPAYIEAVSHTPGPELDDHLMDDLQNVSYYVGKELWQKTDLTPADVDVAELYDGFSFQTLQWLEHLGLAPRGESGAMAAAGHFALDGPLPLCTDGGQLGVGRYHGLEKLAEAARQLWGDAQGRQVPGVEVALAGSGGGPRGTAVLLTKG